MGDKLRKEAEKILTKTTIFGFGKSQKFEDASEKFKEAGNAFKLEKNWSEAGQCFIQAASAVKQSDNPNDARGYYVEAGNCYKRTSPQDAIEAFDQAIDYYTRSGGWSMAAR